jgi:hypothetical protein
MKITFVRSSFKLSKTQKEGSLSPSEKVLITKIDLHENEWVYCNKPLYISYVQFLYLYFQSNFFKRNQVKMWFCIKKTNYN